MFCLLSPAEIYANESSLFREKIVSLLPVDAKWSLVLLDAPSGKELFAIGSGMKERLMPGSLVKLFTGGAILEHAAKHGAFDLRTAIYHDGAKKTAR